jgi:hypothetical protein
MRYLFFQESHIGAWQLPSLRARQNRRREWNCPKSSFQVFPAIHPDVHRGDFADLDLLQCASDHVINHLDFIRG